MNITVFLAILCLLICIAEAHEVETVSWSSFKGFVYSGVGFLLFSLISVIDYFFKN